MLQSNLAVYLTQLLQFGPVGIGWTLFGVGVIDIVSQGMLSRWLMPRLGARPLLAAELSPFNLSAPYWFACVIALGGLAVLTGLPRSGRSG